MRAASLGVVLFTALACGGRHEAAAVRGGGPVPVLTGLAEKRNVPVRLQLVGTVESMKTVDIRPQVGGVLASASARAGSPQGRHPLHDR
jgi:multidrug efflux pump subunit AcrA (membrane-fusion protein)